MIKVLVIHGPNLNLLGAREPGIYGSDTLATINKALAQQASKYNIDLQTVQSNHEGEIVDCIQQAGTNQTQYIIINPAAFTHTSIAIRDAFLASNLSFIEVHLSNIYAREDFRKHSCLSDIATGVISGFGKQSYLLALEAVVNQVVVKQAETNQAAANQSD